jgi:membrane associated rhomboid family serine protease
LRPSGFVVSSKNEMLRFLHGILNVGPLSSILCFFSSMKELAHQIKANTRMTTTKMTLIENLSTTVKLMNVFRGALRVAPMQEQREEDIAQLRLLAGQLNADWRGQDFMAPALARRIRDFQFAQEKRRKRYGDERPWGVLGLYDHLAAIRVDVEWAEDAAWRRANGEPYLSWADFDASKNKGIHRPFFTYFLLLVCSVVLVISIALNGWIVEPLDVNPMIGPSAQTLIRMGAKDSFLIVNANESWRLLSSTVLHAGLVHYFINTLALWFVGKAIETTHGIVAAAILFVIPAIGGTILSGYFLPEYITVGASGGIFGLIGGCLADIIMNWKLLFCDFVTENGKRHRHAMVVAFLLMDVALNCVIGLTPFVDNFTQYVLLEI